MLIMDERSENLINAIGNVSRLKILLALWNSDKELTIYKICRITGLGRSSAVRHVRNLVGSKLVLKRVYGDIPLYAINKDRLEVSALINFFRKARL